MSADSFVAEQICRIDGQLDRLQLSNRSLAPHNTDDVLAAEYDARDTLSTQQKHKVHDLRVLIKSVSAAPGTSTPWTSTYQVNLALDAVRDDGDRRLVADGHVQELQLLLLHKVTNQIYGKVLQTILDQTLRLNDNIWYWDDILTSHRYATLYSIQTSPLRLWQTGMLAFHSLHARRVSFSSTWNRFHALVEEVVKVRNLEKLRTSAMSPLAKTRLEARKKQERLVKMKNDAALALGLLLDLGQPQRDPKTEAPSPSSPSTLDTASLSKSLSLMEAILSNKVDKEVNIGLFKASTVTTDPQKLADGLQSLLNDALPRYLTASSSSVTLHGRPSTLVRYWLPITALFLSSSTVLRVLVKRKADILTWTRELGATVLDFWSNWVVEPGKKLIGTIRHDANSEVAIMSKRSLEGDRNSLERMVVDFAVANPEGNTAITEAEIAEIRTKVREGDLTLVLRAYEKDMAKPFIGAVRGNLIQALLIQIQKTKVDVEVAMGGIDSLLKSQELLFGLIGVTPGVLISIAAFRWFSGIFGNRTLRAAGRKQGKTLTVLRRIDRILSSAELTAEGDLSYKDYGLLIIEIHELRQLALQSLPQSIFKEFKTDLHELTNIHHGASRQKDALKRIRWSYKKWY